MEFAMHPFLNVATKAARQAGELITMAASQLDELDIEQKSANDFVSEVDRKAERIITKALRKAYPDHAILGEEGGKQGDENSDFEWIIDPLDGTTNFVRDIQHFCISIALKEKGRLSKAIIFDPFRDEMFTASRGEGATLNSRRIRVSDRKDLQSGALLATGVPFSIDRDIDLYLQTMKVLVPGTAGVRRMGSAALDLAYVACGRFDGYWEFQLQEWDIAAGVLLVQEAGGLVGDLNGGNKHLKTGNVLAANPKLFKEMVQRLHPVMPK